MKYDKTCRNCEYAYLKTCKGCSTFGDHPYENFKLRSELQKIEDGTLVELPKPFIDEMSVIDDNGDIHIRYDVYCSKIKTYFNDSFYDKEAAEARLKELTEKE